MTSRDLGEGECGRENSLLRLTSHFIQDHGYQEEGLRHPLQQGQSFTNSDADQLVQQFLEETHGNSPQPYRMDSLLQEMREIESSVTLHPPVQAPGVAALAAADPKGLECENTAWADQYLESGKQFLEAPQDNIWNPEVGELSDPSEVYEFGFGPNWTLDYLQSMSPNVHGPLLGEHISPYAESEVQEAARNLLQDVANPELKFSKFMKFMQQVGDGKVIIDSSGEVQDRVGELEAEKLWLPEESVVQHEETRSDFKEDSRTRDQAEGFSESWKPEEISVAGKRDTQDEDYSLEENSEFIKDYWSMLQNSWKEALNSYQENEEDTTLQDYTFETDNPMESNPNVLEIGKKKLEEGDLVGAVLCFEAAVKQDNANSEAWELLGTSQAKNEKDPSAILALKNCLKLDPNNLKALMALAISYTNENFQNHACMALKKWLERNPKYSDLVMSDSDPVTDTESHHLSSFLTRDFHKKIQELYIKAANRNPSGSIDPDVQNGLGVLFNLSNELDKAVDCFKAALTVQPMDFQTWNRLGATLANGSRSEEAVEAYHHALQLYPGYIRARYNLGITCVSLGAYREAVEHFLTALNQQASAKNNENDKYIMSDNIWSSLRIAVSSLPMPELIPYVSDRNLKKLTETFLSS